jgi:hypothetical protein
MTCVAATALPIFDWLGENSALVWWLSGLSIGSLVLCVVLMPWFVARLPEDYLVAPDSGRNKGNWALRIGKNVLGVVFVLAGVAMLVLPGQGLLVLLIGLLLVDFPGRRKLVRRIVKRPKIKKFLDRMRQKRGKPPLRVD